MTRGTTGDVALRPNEPLQTDSRVIVRALRARYCIRLQLSGKC